MAKAVRILRFGSKTCPACEAMRKARTIERFQEAHPEVGVHLLDVTDAEGESPDASESEDGVDYDANYTLSDEYGVQTLPVVIFEVQDVGEVARIEGIATFKELNEIMGQLNQLQARAQKLAWKAAVSGKAKEPAS